MSITVRYGLFLLAAWTACSSLRAPSLGAAPCREYSFASRTCAHQSPENGAPRTELPSRKYKPRFTMPAKIVMENALRMRTAGNCETAAKAQETKKTNEIHNAERGRTLLALNEKELEYTVLEQKIFAGTNNC